MADFDPDKFLAEERAKDEERARVNAAIAAGKSAPLPQPVSTPATTAPFNPDEFLAEPMPVQNTGMPAPQPTALPEPGMVAPIVPYNPASTGMANLARETIEAAKAAKGPAVESFKALGERYMGKAGKPLVDVAAMAAGMPIPPMATYETGRAALEAGKGIFGSAKEFTDIMRGLPDETVARMAPLVPAVRDALKGADFDRFNSLVKSKGIERAIMEFVPSEKLAKNADFMSALTGLQTEIAAKPSMVSRIGGPLLRGAARVAGPAALAYDIYEAYPYYQAANVPQRLASGEVRANMATARQAQMNMPTPAALTPQEAANLLASGDERLINIYGGVNKLLQQSQGQAAQQPSTNFIDQAMNVFNRYRGVPVR